MAYKLNQLQYDEINFDKEVKALTKFLSTGWEISAQPKGYAAYLKDYRDYQGMEDLDEEALLKSFEGHDGAGTVSLPFVLQVSLPHVAYDDKNQGRRPLDVLIGAILSYGMLLGKRMAEVDTRSEVHYRMTWLYHACQDLRYLDERKDLKLILLTLQEIEEYKTNFKETGMQILNKFRELKREVLCKKLKRLLDYHFSKRTTKPKRTKFAESSDIKTLLVKLSYETLTFDIMKADVNKLGYNIIKKSDDYTLYPKKQSSKGKS